MTKAEPSRCFLPGIWNLDSLLVGCFLGTETQELWGNHLLLRAREKERWEGSLQKKSEADKQRKAEMSLAMFSAILVPSQGRLASLCWGSMKALYSDALVQLKPDC